MSSTKVNNRYIPFALIIINCSNTEEVIPYFPIFLIVIIDRDITIPVPLVFVFKNFYQQSGDAKKPYFL
jgi:hypothetical protein